MSEDRVRVVGVGACSPFGLDALSTVMMARAGLMPLEEVPWDDKHGEPIGLNRCTAIADGVQGFERLLALAVPALREAASGAPGPTPLFVALPERGRADDDPRLESGVFLSRLAVESGVPVDLSSSSVIRAGHAGGALAVERACAAIRRGSTHALVGGVDSYCHEGVLAALDRQCRLHSPSADNGFLPSEAAAFTLLAARGSDAVHGAATIVAVGAADEGTVSTGRPNIAAAMTEIVAKLTPERIGSVGWVLVDDNGEIHRAEEWAFVMARSESLKRASHDRIGRRFGDTGAASAVLAMIDATLQFRAGCAPAPRALIAVHSDGPERGAFVLEAVP